MRILEFTLFTESGKNLNDDSVDALALLSDSIGYGIKCVTMGERLFYAYGCYSAFLQ